MPLPAATSFPNLESRVALQVRNNNGCICSTLRSFTVKPATAPLTLVCTVVAARDENAVEAVRQPLQWWQLSIIALHTGHSRLDVGCMSCSPGTCVNQQGNFQPFVAPCMKSKMRASGECDMCVPRAHAIFRRPRSRERRSAAA